MDDVLDKSHAPEIGNKVNASTNATALVNRIREVVRRRRLLAPELAGPQSGLDPNTIAEYLDNTLDADTVADVEKVCLDSDMHLAEVAACHQVLTIVLGEPVEVPERTRERMYALGPSRHRMTAAATPNSETVAARSNEAPPQPELERVPVRSVTLTPPKPVSENFSEGVPDYLIPVPFWKRVVPAVIAVILVGGWAIMMYRELTDRTPSDTSTLIAANDKATTAPQPAPDGDSNSESPTTQMPQTAIAANDVNEAGRFNRRQPEQVPSPLEPARPANPPSTDVASKPQPEPSENAVTASSSKNTSPMPITVAKADVPKPPTDTEKPNIPAVDSILPGPEVLYTSRGGRLANRTPSGWGVLPYRSTIRRGDRVCSPYPFSAQFEIASLGLSIELLPGSSMEFAGATTQEVLVLDVQRGRVSIKRADKDSGEPLTIGLRLAGEPCQLTLLAGQTLCGLEILPREPDSFELDFGEDRIRGHVAVVSGDVHFVGANGGDDKLGPQTWYSLSVRDRKQPDVARRQTPLVVIPDWLDANKPRMTATERTYATQFEKKVDPDLPLSESVSGLINEKSQMLSTFAARALASTELHGELVKALARAEFEETRVAAIVGLRQWLPQSPRHRELLKEELAQNFAPDHIEAIYRLLWGYNDSDARSPQTSRLLVDWLHHENLVIRHLAFFQIYSLTGQKYDYRPVSPAPQRSAAIERWNMHLERNKGALLN